LQTLNHQDCDGGALYISTSCCKLASSRGLYAHHPTNARKEQAAVPIILCFVAFPLPGPTDMLYRRISAGW
jgi:hypothetical protein